MKLLLFSILILINQIINTDLKNHFRTLSMYKSKTRALLETLYESANKVEYNKRFTTKTKNARTQLRKEHIKQMQVEHTSELPNNNHHHYEQYRYYNYEEVVSEIFELQKKFPDYLKINTAQELYNLPNPGGYCSRNKKHCYHYIVFLTNHNIDNKDKPQILISGEVHGNERVGPTATVELIKLFLNNKDKNKWLNYLLDTRYIVIVPMTNPHGYYDKIREELLIRDENAAVLTKGVYDVTHMDINRDFPYLVKETECMVSIGARVINELYLNHLFSVALSLHGGTECLGYPYGTPNHINTYAPKIPIKYHRTKEGLVVKTDENTQKIVEEYRTGKYDILDGVSTEPPDFFAIKTIAETASDHSTNNKKYQYRTGDMNTEIYPVSGGMEDWAYSASWEGSPIITKSCNPRTYGGYDPERTDYSKYKDAIKSIMFLLEVSHEKVPEQKYLGRENLDCLINLRHNAFFNKISNHKKLCLDELIDGYVPRIIRLSLTLIDILSPYIISNHSNKEDKIEIMWNVGGCITVDETYIAYSMFDKKPDKEYLDKINKIEDEDEITKLLEKTSEKKNGKGIWSIDFSEKDIFKYQINSENKFIVYIAIAKVDKDFSIQQNPDPKIPPQLHLSNSRNNKEYIAKNAGFILKGRTIYKSEISIIEP